MSPQQIEGKMARATDDIYALGATLYELLSGQPPFYENDIAYQVMNVPADAAGGSSGRFGSGQRSPAFGRRDDHGLPGQGTEKRPQSARAVAAWIGMAEGPPATSPKVVPVAFSQANPNGPPAATTEKTSPLSQQKSRPQANRRIATASWSWPAWREWYC